MNLIIDALDIFYIFSGFFLLGIPKEWLIHVFLLPALAAEVVLIPDRVHWHMILAVCGSVLLLFRLVGIKEPTRSVKHVSSIPKPPRRGRV